MPVTKFNVETLRAMPRADVVNSVCINLIDTAYTYLNAAKGIIALGDTDATRDELTAALTEDGLRPERIKSLIKNARQAVEVWASVVEPGHATEEWFDRLTYGEFVIVNRAVKRLAENGTPASRLAEEGYFRLSTNACIGKLELVAERGKTQAQHEAAEEAKASAAPASSSPSPAPESDTQDAPTAKKAAPAKSVRPAIDVLMEKIDAAEKATLELLTVTDEVTAQRILTRLASMKVAADTVVAKRASSSAPVAERQLVGAA